jgi:hypothetical protein
MEYGLFVKCPFHAGSLIWILSTLFPWQFGHPQKGPGGDRG